MHYLSDVVDKQGANSTTIVGRSNSTITLLAGSVPDLRFDRLAVNLNFKSVCETQSTNPHLNTTRGELDANGRFALEVEFIARESRQQIALAHARVADQHHCKRVFILKGHRTTLREFHI